MSTIIPARGTVKFMAWPMGDSDDISIDGPAEWRRPVVALIIGDETVVEHNIGMTHSVIVADEIGRLWEVGDYLESIFRGGGLHWDHCAHLYQPHIDGPVTDAPRIRELAQSIEGQQQ